MAQEESAWHRANRATWDERTPVHVASDFYDVEGFVAGVSTLRSFEADELGPVAGRSLAHLQCHFGLDTLSWARLGASVSGLDFSAPAVAEARRLADRIGIPARFVEADVYDAVSALGQQFDIVYTGRGALNWLPDLGHWAQVVDQLLLPGGRFYVVEGHPSAWMLADDSLVVDFNYFDSGEPFVETDSRDYADPSAVLAASVTYEWPHPIGEVVTALADRGLRIEFLHEFKETGWRRWDFMEEVPGERRLFALPASMPTVPLEYSLLATKSS